MNILKSNWIKLPWWFVGKASRMLWLAFIGVLLVGILIFTLYIKSLASLSSWHTTVLKNEFNTDSKVKNFDEYLLLEDKLFNELDKEIYAKVLASEKNSLNRYTKDSLSNPKRWSKAYNRSFELKVKNPKMGVLLVHGLSDSPYSLHAQADLLHKKGVWVVAMRMPGHGTAPSGLIDIQWQDMAAVVKIGMQRLKEKVGSKPIHIMGYSTGAPLALNYTLSALNDSTLTLPTSLIFYSPAIGVSKAAPLAIWQSRIGHILGLAKLKWTDIAPEYDPFKYNSFAVNAGNQVYLLCNEVQKQFDIYLTNIKNKKKFPTVLSFASIVDSTVSVSATINNLYKRLPKGEHRLVLFDINHNFSKNHLIKHGVTTTLQKIRETPKSKNYRFDLISNMDSKNKKIKNIDLQWPRNLYSLSHLSLPISRDDPLYGDENAPKSPGVQLGNLAIYGESSVLQTSASSFLRQRWNPFHDYTNERVLKFMGLSETLD